MTVQESPGNEVQVVLVVVVVAPELVLPVSADGSEGHWTSGQHASLAVGSQVVRNGFVERELAPLDSDIVVAVISAVVVVVSSP